MKKERDAGMEFGEEVKIDFESCSFTNCTFKKPIVIPNRKIFLLGIGFGIALSTIVQIILI